MKRTTNYTSRLGWPWAALLALAGMVAGAPGQTLLEKPARGGGLDTNAPMIHVDISYDSSANQMNATVDASYGIPSLTPLPAGYAFASDSVYSVLNGNAYNLQYAWNPGGIFTPPAGAAVWIECLSMSPGLENYDGPGNKMEVPPRPWTPIFGTDGSSRVWQWYGRMAHNAFAISNPTESELSATFRIYFGDAVTGAPDAFASYDDALVTLNFRAQGVPEPSAGALLSPGLVLPWLAHRIRRSRS